MYVSHAEDLEAQRAMRQGLRAPWGAQVPKVCIAPWPDVTFRIDGPFMLGLTRDPADWRLIRTEAADLRTSWYPQEFIRRRLALLLQRGQHGEVV